MSKKNEKTEMPVALLDRESPRHKVPVPQQLAILGGIMLLIFGTGFVTTFLATLDREDTEDTQPASVSIPENTSKQSTSTVFEGISIAGTSAFVWDVKNQHALYQKSPDEQLPLASITKLMTVLVAHELLGDQTSIPITDASIRQDGASGLRGGEIFTLQTLSDLTLLSSSNDGAFAIASAVGAELARDGDASTFVEAMNIRANELDLSQTYFRNPTGLDISETEAGAYGSARDVTFLMEYILRTFPDLLSQTQEGSARIQNGAGLSHEAENTNTIIENIPGLIGSKTGYTDLAGGNLVIAFDAAPGRTIIVSVLGSTFSGRFDDVLKLSAAARTYIE